MCKKLEKMDVTEFEKMSASDVSSMLNGKGIPERFCKAFEDNYINGKAFLRLTEPDVRKMAPPIGLTKRICMLIPKVHNSEISKLANFDFGFGWLLHANLWVSF